MTSTEFLIIFTSVLGAQLIVDSGAQNTRECLILFLLTALYFMITLIN